MHTWDETTDLLAYSVFGYVVERVKRDKDPHWGAKPADELARSLDGAITPAGIGGHQALALFRDELLPACRPMEHPLNLAYVATAPSHAAVLFDLVVSASSIFGGLWECGAGAIAAENQTLHWLAELAGFPDEAAGCFVSGGSAANLSALVAARHVARERVDEPPARWCFATTRETHASVHAAARTMDVDVVSVEPDERGRMTGDALAAAIDEHRRRNPHDRLFAVVANAGTTNVGAIDELDAIAELCDAHDLWMHIDGAYGGATLCAPSMKEALRGFERADSFGIDPHKWMFAPYDCAALVYRDPIAAAQAHAQHGDYLDALRVGCRCGSAWPRTARTPTPRRWSTRSTPRAGSQTICEIAAGSRCCSIRRCRSSCSKSTGGTAPATTPGPRAGPTTVSGSWCRRRGAAERATGSASSTR
jgi:glutamate/tyrosine decarboxylase-like PLP-dependent enzyme